MHRHGFKGRKFGRERDQRRALIKGLASNLAINGKIDTTLHKAKELAPYFEKLITKAKIGDLYNRRQVISKMANTESAHKLVDEIAPKLTSRNSGYLRITKTQNRLGDNAEMATVSFVDDIKTIKVEEVAKKPAKKVSATKIKVPKKIVTKKPVIKKTPKENK